MLNPLAMFDPEKALNVVLYVVSRLPKPGPHQVFKTLYFAERNHLACYGSPILSDKFVRMPHGPVPSIVYDLVKALRGELGLPLDKVFAEQLRRSLAAPSKTALRALTMPDLDQLSESEQECLDAAIVLCQHLNFEQLSNLSHDAAWEQVPMNREMHVLDIAQAGGGNKQMLQYIRSVYENHALERQWAA